jgi:hypothetical protein
MDGRSSARDKHFTKEIPLLDMVNRWPTSGLIEIPFAKYRMCFNRRGQIARIAMRLRGAWLLPSERASEVRQPKL